MRRIDPGILVEHAADIVAGRPLYADASGFFFTNYPPVSFYLIAAIGRLVGDQMLGGRIVALLSLVAWTMLLALSARRLCCSWAESSFAALLFAVQLGVFSGFYVGVNVGLILLTQSESELASVLAHEISHVTQHHIARSVSSQKDAMLASLAALYLWGLRWWPGIFVA